MWRLVSALTLVGVTLARPQLEQEPGSLGGLIDEVFGTPKTSSQSVPQVDGDIDSLIKEVFSGNVNTTTPGSVILGSQNQTPSKPDDCECVPYYQCKEGKILENGIGIIDIRSDFDDKDVKPK